MAVILFYGVVYEWSRRKKEQTVKEVALWWLLSGSAWSACSEDFIYHFMVNSVLSIWWSLVVICCNDFHGYGVLWGVSGDEWYLEEQDKHCNQYAEVNIWLSQQNANTIWKRDLSYERSVYLMVSGCYPLRRFFGREITLWRKPTDADLFCSLQISADSAILWWHHADIDWFLFISFCGWLAWWNVIKRVK